MSTNISPKTYFRLTNSENGPDFALAVVPGSPELKLRVASSDGSKLWWLFYPTSDPNEYNICTTYNLETYCLDILGGDNAKATPHLSTISFVKGQLWTLNPAGGTLYKLSNDYSQNGYFLDTISGSNDSVMTKGNSPGQYWSLNAREWISSTTTSNAFSSFYPTPFSTSSATSYTRANPSPTSQTLNTDRGTSSSSNGENAGVSADGKLGMAVGLGIGIPTMIVGILMWCVPNARKYVCGWLRTAGSKQHNRANPANGGAYTYHA